jgi:ABC-type cobalamin transport system permease subunit
MAKKILLLLMVSTLLTACATQQPYGYNNNYGYSDYGYGNNSGGNRHKNALIGGGVGAVAGAAVGTAFGGNDLANAGLGALAGGAVGAAVGAYVDHQQNRQAESQQNGWQQQPYYNGYGNQ